MLRCFRFIKLFSFNYVVQCTFKIKIFSHKNFITFFSWLLYLLHTTKQNNVHTSLYVLRPAAKRKEFVFIFKMLLFVWHCKKYGIPMFCRLYKFLTKSMEENLTLFNFAFYCTPHLIHICCRWIIKWNDWNECFWSNSVLIIHCSDYRQL